MKFNTLFKGLLAGLAVIAYTYGVYAYQKGVLFTGTFYFSSLLIYAVFMFWAAKTAAKASFEQPIWAKIIQESEAESSEENGQNTENEGDFKATLRAAFGVFLIANALYYVFDFGLYNYFDPLMNQVQADAAIEFYRASTPEEEMQKLSENIRQSNIHTVKSLLFQYGKGAIGGFGLSVVLTFLALRSAKPVKAIKN